MGFARLFLYRTLSMSNIPTTKPGYGTSDDKIFIFESTKRNKL